MRKKIFKRLIKKLTKHPSKVYRNIELQILLNASAKAFNKKSKCIIFSSKPLEKYMLFTKELIDEKIDVERIYKVSYRLGRIIKNITGFVEKKDLDSLVTFLYSYIEIELAGELPENFVAKKCYFSKYYSCRECRIMSVMDSGLITGIFSDVVPKGFLVFSERITQGCQKCLASLKEG